MRVEVVFCPGPHEVHEWALDLPTGATVADALRAARAHWPEGAGVWNDPPLVGIWGRKQTPHTVLSDGDRVEVYRDLRVDPKVARRERFNRQGARGAGLFAKRRPGAKPGY